MSASSSSKPPDDRPPPDPGRRSLIVATCVGGCALGAAMVAPAVRVVLAPLTARSGGPRWVRTVKLDQLRDGEPRRVAIVDDRHDAWTVERGIELGSVWLVRHGEEVVALSSVCPHLGCSVQAAASGFSCPCHTSAFDASGKRTSGPSPRDLDRLATKLEDGFVTVDYRRFRIGVATPIEVV